MYTYFIKLPYSIFEHKYMEGELGSPQYEFINVF